jgi:hypothetical protein
VRPVRQNDYGKIIKKIALRRLEKMLPTVTAEAGFEDILAITECGCLTPMLLKSNCHQAICT